jgi:hypothetical protein
MQTQEVRDVLKAIKSYSNKHRKDNINIWLSLQEIAEWTGLNPVTIWDFMKGKYTTIQEKIEKYLVDNNIVWKLIEEKVFIK